MDISGSCQVELTVTQPWGFLRPVLGTPGPSWHAPAVSSPGRCPRAGGHGRRSAQAKSCGGAGGSPGLPSPGEFPSAGRTGRPSRPHPSSEASASWAVGVLPLKGWQSRMLICNVEKSSQDKERHSISRTGGRRKNLRPWPPQPSRAFPGAACPSYQPVRPSPGLS